MEKYLRMSDAFGGSVEIRSNNSRHVMCAGVLAANCFCADSAEYAAHAINSHDELVAMNKELLAALELMVNISLLDVVNSTESDMALSAACNAITKAKAAS